MPTCLPQGADTYTPYHTPNKLLMHLCLGERVTHRLTDTDVVHCVQTNTPKKFLLGVTHLQLEDWGCLCFASAAA